MDREKLDEFLENTRKRVVNTTAVKRAIEKHIHPKRVWKQRLGLSPQCKLKGWENVMGDMVLWSKSMSGSNTDEKVVAIVSAGRIETFENGERKDLDPIHFKEDLSPLLKTVLFTVIQHSIGFDIKVLGVLASINKDFKSTFDNPMTWDKFFHYSVLLEHLASVSSPGVKQMIESYTPISMLRRLYPYDRVKQSFGMSCCYEEARYDWNGQATEFPDDLIVFHTLQTLLVLKILHACITLASPKLSRFTKDEKRTLLRLFSHDLFSKDNQTVSDSIFIHTGQHCYPSILKLCEVNAMLQGGGSELILSVASSYSGGIYVGDWVKHLSPLLVRCIRSWLINGKYNKELDWAAAMRENWTGYFRKHSEAVVPRLLRKNIFNF